MPDDQYFELKRENQKIVDKMLSMMRLKLEKLETVEGLDVTIQLGKPLRGDSSGFTVEFEKAELFAYFKFWIGSMCIIEQSSMRLWEEGEPEYIFGYSEILDNIDDTQPHMDKIIDLYL